MNTSKFHSGKQSTCDKTVQKSGKIWVRKIPFPYSWLRILHICTVYDIVPASGLDVWGPQFNCACSKRKRAPTISYKIKNRVRCFAWRRIYKGFHTYGKPEITLEWKLRMEVVFTKWKLEWKLKSWMEVESCLREWHLNTEMEMEGGLNHMERSRLIREPDNAKLLDSSDGTKVADPIVRWLDASFQCFYSIPQPLLPWIKSVACTWNSLTLADPIYGYAIIK